MKAIILFFWFMLPVTPEADIQVSYNTYTTMETCWKHHKKFQENHDNSFYSGCLEVDIQMQKEPKNGKEDLEGIDI